MGDHTEAISIDYDPRLVSYDQLLQHFWGAHRCTSSNSSRQYMNAIFYRNDQQKQMAEKSKSTQAKKLGLSLDKIKTEILPIKSFTYAEGYHQKYYLGRHGDVKKFLKETYPDSKSMADSTVATRLNAYLGSGKNKDWKQFFKELPSYGLPEELQNEIKRKVGR